MTTSGELVFDMESIHKKPYEILVIGRFGSSQDHQPLPNEICHDDRETEAKRPRLELDEIQDAPSTRTRFVAGKEMTSDGCSRTGHSTVPANHVMMCIPSATHSQKPYIGG